jgi:histidyl-tRNA synthetase
MNLSREKVDLVQHSINGFTGSMDSSNGVELPILEATSLLTAPSGEPSGELGSKGVYSFGSSGGNPCILRER